MGSAPASLADNPFLITLLLEMQTTIFLRTEMSRKTEYVHNPCFLSANILKILGVFAENQISILGKSFTPKLFKNSLNSIWSSFPIEKVNGAGIAKYVSPNIYFDIVLPYSLPK